MNQLKAGAILSYISLGLSNVIGLIYTPFMLRMLGQSEFGLYSLVASVVAYLTILDFGFGNAIIRYTAKFKAENKVEEQYSMFGMFLILYSIIGLISFLAGLLLYFNIDVFFERSMTLEEIHKTQVMVLLLVFNLSITFPLSIFGSIITAYENFVFQKVVNIIRVILNPLVMVIMLFMGYKAIGMVVITTIFNILTLLVNWWYCFNRLKIKIYFGKYDWPLLKQVIKYSFWNFLVLIVTKIYWSSGQFITGVYLGVEDVAIFAIAIQLATYFIFFSSAISGVFLPRFTAMVANNSPIEDVANLFNKIGRLQLYVVLYIYGAFILIGELFIYYWAGEGYYHAYLMTIILMTVLIIPTIQNAGNSILQAYNKQAFRGVSYLIISLVSVGLSFYITPKFGIIGLTTCIACGLFLAEVLVIDYYYHKVIGINMFMFFKQILVIFIVFLFVLLIGYLVKMLQIQSDILKNVISVTSYSIVYWFLMYLFSFNQSEKKLISGIKVRI